MMRMQYIWFEKVYKNSLEGKIFRRIKEVLTINEVYKN